MANRPPRVHQGPPLSNSAHRPERGATKDTAGRKLEPKWVYHWNSMQELGRGSFGVVYKITKEDMSPLAKGRVTVAIKCVDKTKRNGEISGTELTALTALARERHRNIVAYYGKFEQVLNKNPHDCFEFEYIDGGDLYHYTWSFFSGGHNIPSYSIAYFTRQILVGLQYIHSKGFAHRDIKPENLMITKDFVIKITDFGLALKMPQGYNYSSDVAGTLVYLAPEQFADNIQGYAADIWAVGVTVFNLYFKGNFPFQQVDKFKIRRQAMALYPKLLQEKRYDEVRRKEQDLIRSHYREPEWPHGIDEWYDTHKDAYDFIEKLLRVSHTRRPTAERALSEPWIKAIEPQGQQHEQAKPLSPAEAGKNKKVTGLAKLAAAAKPKRKDGRRSKISRFIKDAFTKV